MSAETVTLKAAATTLPPLNKNLSVTNNSSVDIIMLDGFGTDDSQVAYGQSLKQWQTTDGLPAVKAGATGTIVLDDWHDFNGTSTYTKVYSIIYAKASNLFPVKIKGSVLVSKTQSYTPVTITGDDATVMTQTQEFIQTLMANPTSPMAQKYATALKAASDSSNSDTDVDDPVGAFFASTDGFKAVTLDSITAVQTYYDNFPYVWASYQSSKSYYFYTTDSTTVTYLGSMTITVPATPTTDKSLPGFSFTYTDASNKQTALQYIDGLFLDNKDVPNICLSGLFVKKSMLTKNSADNVIVPIVTGTIFSDKVLGYEDQRDTSKPDDPNDKWSGMYNMLHPTNFAGALSLFLTFVGICMGIKYLRESAGELKAEFIKAKDYIADKLGLNGPEDAELGPDDVAQAKSDTEVKMEPKQDDLQAKSETMQTEVQIKGGDVNQSMQDGATKLQQQNNEDQRSELDDEGAQLETEIQGELDAGVNNTQIVNDDDEIDADLTKLDSANPDQLGDLLQPTKGEFADLKVDVDASFAKAEKAAGEDAKAELEEGQQGVQKAEEEEEEIEQQEQDETNGKTTDDDTEFEGEEDIT